MNEKQETIVIGSDHAAFPLKEKLKQLLTAEGCRIEDVGTDSELSVDYVDYAAAVARRLIDGRCTRGILLCGTGLGMSMAANRFSGVRAALCNDLFSAMMSRRHNDANILVMGGRVVGDALAAEILRVWLNTPFEGGRHQTRIDKIDRLS